MNTHIIIKKWLLTAVAGLVFLSIFVGVLYISPSEHAEAAVSCQGRFDFTMPHRSVVIDPSARQVDLGVTLCNGTNQSHRIDIAITGAPEVWRVFVKTKIGAHSINSVVLPPGVEQELFVRMTDFESRSAGQHKMVLNFTSKNDIFSESVPLTAEFPIGADAPIEKRDPIVLLPDYAVVEGPSKETFLYEVLITNNTGDANSFDLQSQAPPGWSVVFADIFQASRLISSVSLENYRFKKIRVKAKAPLNVNPGSYSITMKVSSGEFTEQVLLRADVTGTFDVRLSTPTDRLNLDVKAGTPTTSILTVSNTGNAAIRDIRLLVDPPVDWEINFENNTVENLAAGTTQNMQYTVIASEDTVPGDYLVVFRANSPETLSSVQMSISVTQSTIWRWFGITLVIIVVVALVGIYVRLGGLSSPDVSPRSGLLKRIMGIRQGGWSNVG